MKNNSHELNYRKRVKKARKKQEKSKKKACVEMKSFGEMPVKSVKLAERQPYENVRLP